MSPIGDKVSDLDFHESCVIIGGKEIFMCFFGNPAPTPTPVAAITPIPAPVDPTVANAAATNARNDQSKKAQAAQGLQSTITSSPLGVTTKPDIQKPTLY